MFEIHLTVKTSDIEAFKLDCSIFGVKPLLIELQNLEERKLLQTDVMTAKSYKEGDWRNELNQSVRHFESLGYEILRKKVEVNPFTYGLEYVEGDDYYESHIRMVTTDYSVPQLAILCQEHGLHLSRNAFKKIDHMLFYQMATLRMFNTSLKTFQDKINQFLAILDGRYDYDKVEMEYCVYDSNIHHDSIWIQDKV